jgi:hypothetical protein
MVKTEVAKTKLFNENIEFRGSEDYLFLLDVIKRNAKFGHVNKYLVGYRIHENNLSSNILEGYKRSIKILSLKLKQENISIKPIIFISILIYQLKYVLKLINIKITS